MKRFFSLLLTLVFLASCQPVDLDAAIPIFETGIDPDS